MKVQPDGFSIFEAVIILFTVSPPGTGKVGPNLPGMEIRNQILASLQTVKAVGLHINIEIGQFHGEMIGNHG